METGQGDIEMRWTLPIIAMVAVLLGIASESPRAQESAAADSLTSTLDFDPAKTDEYLVTARRAAGLDEHETSIYWFRKALAARPSLASELGKELGYQYTWAERADTAIVWFERYLEDHPGDIESQLGIARAFAWSDRLDEALDYYRSLLDTAPERETEVRVGIARVTSWKDLLDEAIALYDSILVEHPDNLEAKIGRAQAINWSGRHRQAAAIYSEMLAQHPDNSEIREGLAQAYRWMGRNDLAAETIDMASLDGLAREIRRDRAPAASYGYSANKDSDDIERQRHEVRGSFSPGYVTRVQAYYARWGIQQPGFPDIDRDQIKALLRHRFSDMLALSVDLGYEWNSYDFSALPPAPFWQEEFNLFLIDAFLTLFPRDYLRVDFGLFRGSLDNPEPVFRGIYITDLNAGLDWRFNPTLMTTGAAAYTDYSDGNSRVSFYGQLEWQPVYQLPIGIRNRSKLITYAGYLGFSEQLNNGYFSPDNYVTIFERGELMMYFGDRVRLMLAGRLGFENDDFDDWLFTGAIDGYISGRLVDDLSLTVGYYNSQSRLDTRSGYQADGWYLTLDYLWVR